MARYRHFKNYGEPGATVFLTTTVLDFAMPSLAADGKRMEDPALAVAYAPPADSGFMRGKATDA